MAKKNWIYIIITGLVAITLIWLSRPASEVDESLRRLDRSQEKQEEASIESQSRHRDVEGTLWASDNETKGNLMLVTTGAIIYIRTSRDFSGLINKNVVVSTDGALDNFTLLDIQENLAKDGYIKVE